MPISAWSSGDTFAPEHLIHRLPVCAKETMPPLPPPLADEARKKLATIFQVARQKGFDLRIPAELAGEIQSVFAFSDFIARTCQRYPEVLDDLLQSGDLKKPIPRGPTGTCCKHVCRRPLKIPSTSYNSTWVTNCAQCVVGK
jgi:hypothetical protein